MPQPHILTVAPATEETPRHAGASMVELNDGAIFLAWMEISRSKFQAGDDAPSDIVALTSRDGGRTWGGFRKIIERGPNDTAAYKPSLLRLKSGAIGLRYEMYHRFVMNEPRSVSAYFCTSRDECRNFSRPVTIFDHSPHLTGSFNDVRQLKSGRIVVPVDHVKGNALQDEGKGLAPTDTGSPGSFYSDDEGQTWNECAEYLYLPMRGASEPKIEELKDGRILMVMRTQLGSVFKSISNDSGHSWSKPQTTGLISPESCPALARIAQTGDLMIVWNRSLYDPMFDHYGKRTPLTIAISKDEGQTWGNFKNVETDPEWEFTNPAPIVTTKGTVLLAYEASKYENLVGPGKLGRSRMSLKLAIIDLDWIYA